MHDFWHFSVDNFWLGSSIYGNIFDNFPLTPRGLFLAPFWLGSSIWWRLKSSFNVSSSPAAAVTILPSWNKIFRFLRFLRDFAHLWSHCASCGQMIKEKFSPFHKFPQICLMQFFLDVSQLLPFPLCV